jgi:hypothetical protein
MVGGGRRQTPTVSCGLWVFIVHYIRSGERATPVRCPVRQKREKDGGLASLPKAVIPTKPDRRTTCAVCRLGITQNSFNTNSTQRLESAKLTNESVCISRSDLVLLKIVIVGL